MTSVYAVSSAVDSHKVLAKFGLCSNCLQKLDECLNSLPVHWVFATARMLRFFSLKFKPDIHWNFINCPSSNIINWGFYHLSCFSDNGISLKYKWNIYRDKGKLVVLVFLHQTPLNGLLRLSTNYSSSLTRGTQGEPARRLELPCLGQRPVKLYALFRMARPKKISCPAARPHIGQIRKYP